MGLSFVIWVNHTVITLIIPWFSISQDTPLSHRLLLQVSASHIVRQRRRDCLRRAALGLK